MIRTISRRALGCAIVFFSLAAARAQTLTLEVELVDLETWISNNMAATILVDAYQISSAAGILDPINWLSIEDSAAIDSAAVSAALGSGAVSFIEAAPTSNALGELDPISFATWEPGTRWSIGFPFGTSLSQFHSRPFDAVFEYTGPSVGVIQGAIEFILVPEPAALSLAAIALLKTSLLGRYLRCATRTPGGAGGRLIDSR